MTVVSTRERRDNGGLGVCLESECWVGGNGSGLGVTLILMPLQKLPEECHLVLLTPILPEAHLYSISMCGCECV